VIIFIVILFEIVVAGGVPFPLGRKDSILMVVVLVVVIREVVRRGKFISFDKWFWSTCFSFQRKGVVMRPRHHTTVIVFILFGRLLMMTRPFQRRPMWNRQGNMFPTVFVVIVGNGISLTDFVKVRLVSWIGTTFPLAKARGRCPFHPLDQVRHTLQEQLVVVRVDVGTLCNSLETPAIDLARETFEFGNLHGSGIVGVPIY